MVSKASENYMYLPVVDRKNTDKLLWMHESLQLDWKSNQPTGLSLLVDIASSAAETAAGVVNPALKPSDILAKIGNKVTPEAATIVGFGLFNRKGLEKNLDLSKEDKEDLKNDKALFKAIAKGTYLLVWASVTGVAPVLSGIVIVTGVLKYLVKKNEIDSKKRWAEIVASMMDKYSRILQKAADKIEAKRLFDASIEEVRKDADLALELDQDKKSVATVKNSVTVSELDLVRLRIYCHWFLNITIDNNHPVHEQAMAFAAIRKNIGQYFQNEAYFLANYGTDTRRKAQQEKVASILKGDDTDETFAGADIEPSAGSLPNFGDKVNPSTIKPTKQGSK